jgi:hypothetical protein
MIRKALDDPRPSIPAAEAFARVRASPSTRRSVAFEPVGHERTSHLTCRRLAALSAEA